jgi:5-methylcytosine-specific restriction protein A
MPILRPCRTPYCAEYAQADGWCARHWQPPYGADPLPMSPNWPAIRRFVLERDRQRCQLCGVHGTHVDHIKPRSAGGSDHPSNLQTLCVPCHRRETGRLIGLV